MRTACEPLFWLSHGDQRMTEWKSCASFTHCTLSHEPSGRACTDLRGGSQGWEVKPAKLLVQLIFKIFLFLFFSCLQQFCLKKMPGFCHTWTCQLSAPVHAP